MEKTLLIKSIKVRNRHRKDLGNLEELIGSIEEVGLLHPIVVTEDNLLVAGERRLEAYRKLDREAIPSRIIKIENVVLGERDENFCRKDFTLSEKVAITEELKEIEEKKAKERQKEHAGTAPGKKKNTSGKFPQVSGRSKDLVAKTVGLSGKTLEKASAVTKAAKEDPKRFGDLQESMDKKGKADKAFKELGRRKDAEKVAKLASSFKGEEKILEGDFADIAKAEIEPASVDAIVTDPPYGKDSLPLLKKLAEVSSKILKDGGSLMFMFGQSYVPEVLEAFSGKLKYHWTIAYLTPGGQSPQIWDRHVNSFWKPIFWYVKGGYIGDWIGDVVKSKEPDKSLHEWGQNLEGTKSLVQMVTRPGDLVFDPFLGGGTTALACRVLGRKFIGCDIDKKAVESTKGRLNSWTA